jgi:hypothetical protein
MFPGPIDDTELRWYTAMLELDAVDAVILESVHQDYVQSFRALEDERLRPFAERQNGMWRFDPGGTFSAPSEAQVETSYRERADLLVMIREIDDRFFEDVSVLLPEDAAERLATARRARLRTMYNRPSDGAGVRGGGPLAAMRQGMRGGMGGSRGGREETIDLTRLIELAEVPAAERVELHRQLRGYEMELTEAMQQRYEVMLETNKAAEQLAAIAAQAQQDGGRFDWSVMMRGDFQSRMEAMTRRTDAARARIVELNRSAVAGLEGGAGVQELYRRAAYPGVYRDPDNAEGSLLAAMELESLSFDQQERIGDLLLDFRGPYNDLSERMITLEAEDAVADEGDRMARWQRRQGQRSTMERLRFERSELSERTIRRLMGILTEAQRQELGLVDR